MSGFDRDVVQRDANGAGEFCDGLEHRGPVLREAVCANHYSAVSRIDAFHQQRVAEILFANASGEHEFDALLQRDAPGVVGIERRRLDPPRENLERFVALKCRDERCAFQSQLQHLLQGTFEQALACFVHEVRNEDRQRLSLRKLAYRRRPRRMGRRDCFQAKPCGCSAAGERSCCCGRPEQFSARFALTRFRRGHVEHRGESAVELALQITSGEHRGVDVLGLRQGEGEFRWQFRAPEHDGQHRLANLFNGVVDLPAAAGRGR
jgi:hypothetical protein